MRVNMRVVFIIIFILIILFLQIGILPHLAILGAYPNLILISVLSLVILRGWKKNLGWIVAAGLFFDFYSSRNILGISILIILVISIIVQFLSQKFFKKTDNLSIFLVFLAGLIIYEIVYLSFPASLIRIIYDLIFVLPIFHIIKKVVAPTQILQFKL
jgi:rod shape-determining protein MreD